MTGTGDMAVTCIGYQCPEKGSKEGEGANKEGGKQGMGGRKDKGGREELSSFCILTLSESTNQVIFVIMNSLRPNSKSLCQFKLLLCELSYYEFIH